LKIIPVAGPDDFRRLMVSHHPWLF